MEAARREPRQKEDYYGQSWTDLMRTDSRFEFSESQEAHDQEIHALEKIRLKRDQAEN